MRGKRGGGTVVRGRDPADKTTCPFCGATDQVMGEMCHDCRRWVVERPEWAEHPRRKRLITRRRMMVLAALMVLLAAVVWTNYPFVPNPVILIFKRPSTNLSSASLPGQWAMHGRDLQQTSYVPDARRQPEGKVTKSLDLGLSTRSSPAVVDGVIYAGGYFKIMAIDAETGRGIWEVPATGPVHSSPAVAGEMLYLGLLDSRILALDRQSGKIRWSFKADDPIPGSGAVDNGIVYMGSLDGTVYALDAENGGLIWKFETDDSVTSAPAIYNGKILIASSSGSLYVRNSRTGDKRFRFRTSDLARTPSVDARGLVYLPSGGDIVVVDAEARELPYQYEISRIWAQLWFWRLGVPMPPGQPGGKWRLSSGSNERFLYGPAVTPEALYVGGTKGGIYAIDPLDQTKLWKFQAEARIMARPLVVDERLYVGTQDGLLYALDRFSGESLWILSLSAPLASQPVFAEDRIYARTKDGMLHFID